MKVGVIAVFCFFLSTVFGFSAPGETDPVARAEVSKLAFLTGKWAGKGWIMGRDRQKAEFDQTEDINFKLDNSILLIEGRGMTGGKVTHNAMAVVSWAKDKGHFEFRSYLADGRRSDFKAKLVDGKFLWYPNEKSRYTISLNAKGQWHETGEYLREGNWHQFFEMTLDKL